MLDGKSIWITRPEGQSESLAALLQQAGANVRSVPMLRIDPLPLDAVIKSRVMDLDHYQQLFFISTNAAGLGMALIDNYWPQFPVGLDIYAVGPTTAAVIEAFGLKVNYPQERMSSEALLALPSLADIAGSKALIVRGVGGRELLAEELRKRGASVDYLELYRRECPEYDAGVIGAMFTDDKPAAVIITSAEALACLKDLLEADKVDISCVPLYVSSARIAEAAQAAGFGDTITMPGADDKAIIDTLKRTL
jgi:uroporphyrinogen-III synthase